MGLVVITGGVRSGKSTGAQQLAEALGREGRSVATVVFARPSDDLEMQRRIDRHRASRPEGFRTIEAAEAGVTWMESVGPDDVLLVDCLGTMLGLSMERAYGQCFGEEDFVDADRDSLPAGFEERVLADFEPQLSWLIERMGNSIVVTNEVGSSVIPESAMGRLFSDVLGHANRRLVAAADASYLAVCGRFLDLSALPLHPEWPED